MPNWCFNRLEVSKHNESGRKLIDAFRENHVNDKGEKYSRPFTDLLPTPEDLMIEKACGGEPEVQAKRDALYQANKAKYGFESWYEWRVENWGTKWDACEVQFTDEDDNVALIYFETAWSPPTAFLQWYAEEHPDEIGRAHV